MIVYSGSKREFQNELINGQISKRLDNLFHSLGLPHESYSEFKSWGLLCRELA